jgi:hypothetical protein
MLLKATAKMLLRLLEVFSSGRAFDILPNIRHETPAKDLQQALDAFEDSDGFLEKIRQRGGR